MASSSTPFSLPGRLSPFIGRQADLQRMLDLLQDPAVRLVTILGLGGIGKTRFALEVISLLEGQFRQPPVFVPLAALNSGDELLPTLAQSLGVKLLPGGNLKQAVLDLLSSQQTLIVFDNIEHLLDESILVRDILDAAPHVKVLVTSREKLRLEVETLFYLHGLELPGEDSQQSGEVYDAVQLFLQKARQARPDFSLTPENTPAVIQICRLVDGNPLGILIAAAWLEHFSPTEVVEQINNSLDFLTSSWQDTEPRHASMLAVLDSSYQRLGEADQAVFRKLAIFRGGFDLPAAQAIAGAKLRSLIGLVEKSLLSRSPGSGRYEMHELLRQYAGEALDKADERERLTAAHARYYSAFVQDREPRLISKAQTAALDEIKADFDNIRQACLRIIEKRDFDALRLVLPGLYAYCDMHSRIYEGEMILRQAVKSLAPLPGEKPHPTWALALLSWYDHSTYFVRFEKGDEIESQARSCLEHAKSMRDSQGIAASLVLLGAIAEDQGNFEAAIHDYEEAMRVDPSLDDMYWVIIRIGLCHQAARQYPEAIQAFRLGLQRAQKTGERVKAAWSLLNIGDTLLLQKKPVEARGHLEQARELFQEVGTHIGLIWSNYSLGRVALSLGNQVQAREHAEIADRIARQIHSNPWNTWIRKIEDLFKQIDLEFPSSSQAVKGQEQVFLSQREQEVLQLLKSELSGPEIARRLYVSLNTVRYHTKNLYQKLGVNTRLEAIQRARELGL